MQLLSFKSLWDMTGTLEEKLEKIAEAGYGGVEFTLPSQDKWKQFRELLERYNLAFIAQIVTRDDHISSFESLARQAAEFNPVKIVSHSAKDSMSYEDQLHFFEKALAVEEAISVPVAHETHRGRAMFTPWATSKLLRQFPELKITADFSHWCCVCESLLQDQSENMSIALDRAIHIHGRVGYAEGPQVADPRAPEYSREVRAFVNWWLEICKRRASDGYATMTFTPEFGPPGYMHTLPFTKQPVTDVWDVNKWMNQFFIEKYRDVFE
ncbi:MAG: xylose isomerase protein [Paenibacillus sp.]|uniref:sugar phosphate isomerase/epimerase family protein n=1 Tax=Paenibacillus sp. GCM10012303 TaxID=3317340 RepID=UPI0029F25FD7|nr:xylose isomerase protein [Paenibacillus sp.]